MASELPTPKPAALLKLLAHGVRWQLLTTLAQSDHTVQELSALIGRPENLVSYHLGRLRSLHIVTERRSDADSRDVYYSLDVEHLRDLYLAAGAALHPAIGLAVQPDGPSRGSVQSAGPSRVAAEGTVKRVLFLCTHNSARSQMAEALLRDLGKGRIETFSAGTEPSKVRPEAVRAMAEMKLDISQQRPKHLEEYLGQWFDYVITVCDRVKEVCPVFPGAARQTHWSFPDPVAIDGSDEVRERAFRDTAMQLLTRIRLFLTVLEREQVQGR